MNPNLNFAQMQRGPDGQTGSRTGVLYAFILFEISRFNFLQRSQGHGQDRFCFTYLAQGEEYCLDVGFGRSDGFLVQAVHHMAGKL